MEVAGSIANTSYLLAIPTAAAVLTPSRFIDVYKRQGILRSLVNIKDLELVDEKTISGPGIPQSGPRSSGNKNGSGSSKIKMSKSFSISPEINLIGMTVDEAVPALDKYLDDAYLRCV